MQYLNYGPLNATVQWLYLKALIIVSTTPAGVSSCTESGRDIIHLQQSPTVYEQVLLNSVSIDCFINIFFFVYPQTIFQKTEQLIPWQWEVKPAPVTVHDK